MRTAELLKAELKFDPFVFDESSVAKAHKTPWTPSFFLGWTSQTVCYECNAPPYTGVDHIGSDVADRDALLWAGLWRLSIDSDLPTTFCFDSIVAGHFADGTYGTAKPSQQHRLLRGVFQLACSLGLSRLVDLDAAQREITSVRECGLARKRTPLQRLQGELV